MELKDLFPAAMGEIRGHGTAVLARQADDDSQRCFEAAVILVILPPIGAGKPERKSRLIPD
jgi:hypothetical protein